MIPVKRICMKCGVLYWDDGCTWCPHCDAASTIPTRENGMLPDASTRILEYRLGRQAELERRFAEEGST
jgi:uncharacterized Zn finger protein (UPF0148 family)